MFKYKLCLLDFDGTLFDTIESLYDVFINSYAEVGMKIEKEDCLLLTRIRLIDGYKLHNGDMNNLQKFYDAIERYLNAEETVKKTKIYYDTKSFIENAKKNDLDLGIVTSNNLGHVGEVLKFFDIPIESFRVMVGNRETKQHKPYPDPMFKALEFYGEQIDKDKVIYIGDGDADMISAKSAGIKGILIDRNDEYSSSEYEIIKSLNDIFEK